MVSHLKKLSEDEKIRQQLEAREDNERRLRGEYKRGMAMARITQVKTKFHKGKPLEQIADELEETVDEIKLYYDAIKANPTLTPDGIYDICKRR